MNVAQILKDMSYGPAPEDASYVRDWLKERESGFELFIDGAWRKSAGGSVIESTNPANGEGLAKYPSATADDVNQAVLAAKNASPQWAALKGHERAKFLYALSRLLQKNSRFIAVLETLDNGKPIRETRDVDIPLAARHFLHHAGWAQLFEERFADYEPVGVAGQIIPWNFPFLMLAWKIAPALAAGNTVVLKPSEYTSLTALYFAELCIEAGLPNGVVNIVTGDGQTGEHIVDHDQINKIAFTGSTPVGRRIRERTAGTGKKLSLELGGKSPFIVFQDADLDGAVEGLVDAIWFNQGEVCCAGSRLLVDESIADKLIDKIKRRLGQFRVGDPLDKTTDMGAIVHPNQMARIQSLLKQGIEEGADLWQPDIEMPKEGCFFPPSLFTNVEPSHTVVQEEIFGPVLSVISFRTTKEAIDLANNTRYGLAASIWSENINRALEVAAGLKAGVVWVNSTNQFDAACGFGGYRESGFGREGGYEGMLEYLKPAKEWRGGAPTVIETGNGQSDVAPTEGIDQTAKNYIGGKQSRPDGGRTRPVLNAKNQIAGRVGEGNRKDIRDAVEAAFKNQAWTNATAHNRAQVLYYLAENLDYRSAEFADRLVDLAGVSRAAAKREVGASVSRLFTYGAWADKYEGQLHRPPVRNVVLSDQEAIGIIGIVCPDAIPLLSFVSLFAPALAMGNRTVIVPSERYPLIATDFYQVLETSDVPAGALNLVTGDADALAKVLADHDQVDALWYHRSASGSEQVERASSGNLKQTWVNHGRSRDWFSDDGEGKVFLKAATQIKTIWLPYGDW